MPPFLPGPAMKFLLLLFLVAVFMPFLMLVLDLALKAIEGTINWQAWLNAALRRSTLLKNSINLAVGVSIAGMLTGVAAASRLWHINKRPYLYLRWLVLLFAVVPPYIHALAWSTVFSMLVAAFGSVGLSLSPLGGWGGSWLVQYMAFLPLCVGLALLGLETVDPLLLDAARMQRSDQDVFLKTALPLAGPAILAGCGFVFIFSLMDYSVPSLFGKNVYALEIFAEHSATGRAASAFLVSLPMLLLAAAIIYFSQAPLREAAVRPPWGLRPWMASPKWPVYIKVLQLFSLLILAAQVVVPLVGLIVATGGWEALADSVRLARREVVFSLYVALMTAFLILPLAYPVAYLLTQPGGRGVRWWLATILPLAVPAPLVGIGLIVAWNRPIFGGIYGSEAMPVLAALARFAPFAALLILVQLRRLDPLLIDAARVMQRRVYDTALKVYLPMLAPGLIAAFCFTFALTLGELGATLIVAPPGRATVTMRLYNLLHYGASDLVAGLCLLMVIVTVILAALAFLVIARRNIKSSGR